MGGIVLNNPSPGADRPMQTANTGLRARRRGFMSIEDFTMYDDWNQYRHALAEQPPVVAPRQVVLAGWGSRFGAYLIDSILLSIPMMFFVWSEFKPLLDTYAASASVDPATGQIDQTA